MKVNIILIVVSILFSLTAYTQNNKSGYIFALSVDLYINTSSRVSCDNFATVFEKILTANKISQNDSINMFLTFVRNVKYSRKNRGVDVRSKFIFESDTGSKTIVCSNEHFIIVNGRLIKQNKKFSEFLNSLVHEKGGSLKKGI